jgi:hypothetical protein
MAQCVRIHAPFTFCNLEDGKMGKPISQGYVITASEFDKIDKQKFCPLYKIQNADVYWSNNAIILVASQKWKDFLLDKTDVAPTDEYDDLSEGFFFDDEEFLKMLNG